MAKVTESVMPATGSLIPLTPLALRSSSIEHVHPGHNVPAKVGHHSMGSLRHTGGELSPGEQSNRLRLGHYITAFPPG